MQTTVQLPILRLVERPAKVVTSRQAEKAAGKVVAVLSAAVDKAAAIPAAAVDKAAAIPAAAVVVKVVIIRADLGKAAPEVCLVALHEASLPATGRPRSSADEAEFMHLQ